MYGWILLCLHVNLDSRLQNHSIVQSSFSEPCQPLGGGFFSGFVPSTSPDSPSRTSFTLTVGDKNPKWVYCSQADHCKKGMVHAINVYVSCAT